MLIQYMLLLNETFKREAIYSVKGMVLVSYL
jgi:hypothetical protein